VSISEINWAMVGTIITVGGLLFGAMVLMLRANLSSVFVTRIENREMLNRLEAIEQSLSSIPRHADMLALERRFGEVAERVSGVTSSVYGFKDDLSAVRYQLNMIIESQMKAEQSR
jgi:hypothetical protein